MATYIAYVANTNNVEARGLRSDAEGIFLNDVNVTVTVKDAAGQEISGVTWPLAMAYVEGSSRDHHG